MTIRGYGCKDPSTKFKERGRSRFTFDLLVPSSGDEVEIKAVPELSTHATALPYLRYLLGDTQTGAALSSHGVLSVRIPNPERFALPKLIVAQLRRGGSEKISKDLKQAGVLIAALGEHLPGALTEAFQKTPVSARKHLRNSLLQIRESLEPHPRAWDEVAAAAKPMNFRRAARSPA